MSLPLTASQPELDYARIEQAIQYIAANVARQPSVEDIASQVHLSPAHFSRMFTQWAGTSPQRFLRFLTKEYARQLLRSTGDLLHTTEAVGLSSTSRLHELFLTFEAMTPGEYRARAAGLTLRYGFHTTPFGECLLAITDRGICWLSFQADAQRESALTDLARHWDGALLVPAPEATAVYAAQLFAAQASNQRLHLVLKGTNFQIKVWEALLRIPEGACVSYGMVAKAIGKPGAERAVGTAIGSNHIGWLIPCHRVIQQQGGLGGYRWGVPRKQALLAWEAARVAG